MVVDIAIFKMITIFSNLGREILCGWGDRGGKAIEKLVLDRLGTRINITSSTSLSSSPISFPICSHNNRRDRLTTDESAVELELVLFFRVLNVEQEVTQHQLEWEM